MLKLKKYGFLFLVLLGTFCNVYSYIFYNATFIESYKLLMAWVILAMAITFLEYAFTENTFSLKKFFGRTFIYLVTVSGILIFTFLAINFYVPTKNSQREYKAEILKKSWTYIKGRTFPTVLVEVEGHKKVLVFNHGPKVEEMKYVLLNLNRGILGYHIIINSKLLRY